MNRFIGQRRSYSVLLSSVISLVKPASDLARTDHQVLHQI